VRVVKASQDKIPDTITDHNSAEQIANSKNPFKIF